MRYLESRKYVIQAIFFTVGIVFALKLFYIQVLNPKYKLAAENNAIQKIVQYPFRGLIYDRKGKLLVQNIPVYDLMVIPKEIKGIDTLRFCQLFRITIEDFRQKIKEAKTYSYVKPSPFLPKLTTQEFAAIQDNLIEFPGFYINARTVRGYSHQSLSHALGYIGEVSPTQLAKPEYADYTPGDYIGKSGIELKYEKYLMGKKGVKYKMVNVRGIDKGPFRNGEYDTLAVAGRDLVSTIDLDLQQYGEKLMAGKRGTVVAIEPATGEILSFISAPFYDPNLLTGKELGKNYMSLLKNPEKPLLNRPQSSKYPPGSIFKLVQALIALEKGVITPDTGFPCNQSLVKCAHNHPRPSNLAIGIENSCNPYFYMVFKNLVNRGQARNIFADTRLGLDDWRNEVLSFGFANRLGVDLPYETRGNIPASSFYDRRYGKNHWKYKTIYSLSIGQGEAEATPLQMVNLMAIIANKGYYVTPHIIKGIGEKNQVQPEFQEKHHVAINPKHFEPVIQGMSQVMTSRWGTGWYANLSDIGIAVCGKTGTVQNAKGRDHAVFVAFAPRENPKIAIAVYIENAGFGSTSSAPLASLMIQKYLTGKIAGNHWAWWEQNIINQGYLHSKH
ncbi:penicillin-binding protein 2 [Adhaeribacter pallidiroseus]|uniref:Penicillin-binding protein n=1 Tax=Adhaeribacter pallidiroseus TaxID=2072847 RepID=A0A369QLP3_9BACT|nr:penicillin-binding protein 2 [Adhaeribacter pallidiroseus]RDC65270.1 Penicillin-binding protein [Adhaeribacter pallidiroseus]